MQSDENLVPCFVEKCIRFIEDEGISAEGLYRVPGNRAHVDALMEKFKEGETCIPKNKSLVLKERSLDIYHSEFLLCFTNTNRGISLVGW